MNGGDVDIAKIGRVIIQVLLTVGAAIAFFIFVTRVCVHVWEASHHTKPKVDKVLAAVTISLSITFGSAFVGWLGLSSRGTGTTVTPTSSERLLWRSRTSLQFIGKLATSLPGAAVIAMLLYLVAGALAGLTYVLKEDETPRMLVAVATAWAAQASAIIASTLAIALRLPDTTPGAGP